MTKSSQLGSEFTLVGGFMFDQRRSTQDKDVFTAEGGVLSINDYNDENMIQLCLNQGCDYEIAGVIEIDKKMNKKTLTLNVLYFGGKDGMQKLLLTEFILYTKEKVYREKVANPIAIEGNGRKII